MIILLTIVLTLLFIIILLIVLILVYFPVRMTIRFEQKQAIEVNFGRYMKNMWISMDWFSITRVHYYENYEVAYAELLFTLFKNTPKGIEKLNKIAQNDQDYTYFEKSYENGD